MNSDAPKWGKPPPEIRDLMSELYHVENLHAFELFRTLKGCSRLLEDLRPDYRRGDAPSSARVRLLMHLLIHHRMGRTEGLQPSELSEHLRVSRNTVSSLLNALEEQGYIERRIHPTDRRQMLVRITPDGEALLRAHAPEFGAYLVELFSALTEDEQNTLMVLLTKLLHSFIERAIEQGIAHLPLPEKEGEPIATQPQQNEPPGF